MRLLQAGMAKSGNYWLWNILQEIITAGGLPNESFIQNHPIHDIARGWELSFKRQADIDVLDIQRPQCFYRISTIFRMPIKNLDDYLSQCKHVWTHSEYNPMSADVFPRFDKIVLIIRDPRDVLVSSAKFSKTNYGQDFLGGHELSTEAYVNTYLARSLRNWSKYNLDYLSQMTKYNIHVVFYEQLIADFHKTVRDLCNYLDVTLDTETIQSIYEKTHFTTLKQQDPSHVRQGKAYKWVSQFNDVQKTDVAETVGDFLTTIGYPVKDSETSRIPDAGVIDLTKLDNIYKQMTSPSLKVRTKSALIRLINQL